MTKTLTPALLASLAISLSVHAQDLTTTEAHEGFFPLFNGDNLNGWWIRGGDSGFVVEDGVLISTGIEGGGDWLFTDDTFRNFVLRYEYRIQTEGQGNSGVSIRATKDGNPAFSGMEIQIIRPDWETPWQRAGALYATVPPGVKADKPAGEWNSVEILADGVRIRTTMNGEVLYDIKMSDFTPEKIGESEWQKPLTDRAASGHIALQNPGDRVEFRNIRLKELPGDE